MRVCDPTERTSFYGNSSLQTLSVVDKESLNPNNTHMAAGAIAAGDMII